MTLTSAPEMLWTIWECRSVDGRQIVRIVRASYPDDAQHQHEYQRIVAVVYAPTREIAEQRARIAEVKP